MQMDPDGSNLRIWHPNGWEIRPVIEQIPSSTTVEASNAAVAAVIAPEACVSEWDGGRVDPIYIANVVAEHEYAKKRELVSAETL